MSRIEQQTEITPLAIAGIREGFEMEKVNGGNGHKNGHVLNGFETSGTRRRTSAGTRHASRSLSSDVVGLMQRAELDPESFDFVSIVEISSNGHIDNDITLHSVLNVQGAADGELLFEANGYSNDILFSEQPVIDQVEPAKTDQVDFEKERERKEKANFVPIIERKPIALGMERPKRALKKKGEVQEAPDPFEIKFSFGPKIHVDMLKPDTSEIKMPRLLATFLGRNALEYAKYRFASSEQRRAMKDEYLEHHPDAKPKSYDAWKQRHLLLLRKNIDVQRIRSAITEEYTPEEDPMKFYERQIDNANAVIRYIQKNSAPRLLSAIGLKTEIGMGSNDPQEIVTFLLDTDIDPKTQYEARRTNVLAIPCAEIDVYLERSGAREKLREVGRIFNIDLFKGKIGESRRRDFAVVHDSKTNRALRYEDLKKGQRIEEIKHDPTIEVVKPYPMEMREFKDSGIMAQYDPRPDKASAVAKALQEALDRQDAGGDGTVYPLRDVRDLLGMKFIVDDRGNPKVVDRAILQVFNTLVDKGIGLEVKEDHKTNGTSDQSSRFKFRRISLRGMGKNDLPIDLEIVFQGVLDAINGESEIGELSEATGTYDGQFHDGYQSQRLIKHGANGSRGVASLVFSSEIYDTGEIPIDIIDETLRTKNRKAEMYKLP